MLVAMLAVTPDTLAGKRDRALLSIGWAAALHRSELVALEVEDIEPATGEILLHIRRSKTDQEQHGQIVGIPDGGTIDGAWLRQQSIATRPSWARRLCVRSLLSRRSEAKIGCNVLNRMTSLGMPISVRRR
jgi:hypothetical protein